MGNFAKIVVASYFGKGIDYSKFYLGGAKAKYFSTGVINTASPCLPPPTQTIFWSLQSL